MPYLKLDFCVPHHTNFSVMASLLLSSHKWLFTECFPPFFSFLWACKYKILIRNTDRSGAWSTTLHPSQEDIGGVEEERERYFLSHLSPLLRPPPPSRISPLLTGAPDLSSRCHITVYRKAISQHIGWMRSALILASAFVSGVWCESFSFLSATLRMWRS